MDSGGEATLDLFGIRLPISLPDLVGGAVLGIDLVADPEGCRPVQAGGRVTAPLAAEPTRAAYLAITPVA